MAAGYESSLGLAGASASPRSLGGEVSKQVVPSTRRADFHDVEDHVVALRERSQLGLGLERSPLCREPGPEREQHVDQVRFLTDGALGLGNLTEVRRDTQELRLGVAYVEFGELAATKTSHGRVTCEPILDLAEPGGGGCLGSGLG